MVAAKFWREASTVIIAASKSAQVHKPGFNYKLLALKRSKKSQFMPGGYVFPGGVTNPSDSSLDWIKLFEQLKIKKGEFDSILKTDRPLSSLFEGDPKQMHKLISLRITAIREAFEETGILLCKSRQDSVDTNNTWGTYQSNSDLPQWRLRVQEHPEEFLNLCHHFDCYPDIWCLNLWSNWLTPKQAFKKRFDTAFFVATLKHFPESHADETEIEKVSWFNPSDLLKLCKEGDIWLPPPQVYEVARLMQFPDISDLSRYAFERNSKGCERWMPERYKTTDGEVSVLPGDSLYPPKPELQSEDKIPTLNISSREFRNESEVLHRMEHLNEYYSNIVIKNFNFGNDHVLPITDCD